MPGCLDAWMPGCPRAPAAVRDEVLTKSHEKMEGNLVTPTQDRPASIRLRFPCVAIFSPALEYIPGRKLYSVTSCIPYVLYTPGTQDMGSPGSIYSIFQSNMGDIHSRTEVLPLPT